MSNRLRSAMAAAGFAASSGESTPSDPYFENVSLLLHGDGTNGAQNNTFLDSSTNNFTITRNGNTTQGSFSPYGNLWSNYLDGASKFRTTSFTAISAGQDFTVEAWVFQTTQTPLGLQCIATPRVSSGSWYFGIYNNNIFYYDESTSVFQGTAVTPNTWHHLAFSRQGTTHRLFIDGALVATVTATAQAQTGAALAIGADNSSNNSLSSPYYGYLSNLRVVIGTALYISTFAPSTTPLTAVSGTAFLGCQSNRFIDNSSNNYTINVSAGTPSVQRFSPFNPTAPYSTATIGGSGYFDGTGDYLTTSGTGSFNASSGNWTIEAWMYCTDAAASDPLITGNTNNFYIVWLGSDFYLGDGIINTISSANSKPLNQWFHVAVVKNGSTYTAYINGTSIGSSTIALNNITLSTWSIGYYYAIGSAKGYISNLRVVNGTAIYTSNFTPPTSPLTAITNTSLLLNFTNAGIFDNAAKNDLETVGNAQVSTSVKKYGTGSMYFYGGGSLTAPNSSYFNFGTTDFTVECWMNSAVPPSSYTLQFAALVAKGSGNAAGTWGLSYYQGKITFYCGGSGLQGATVVPNGGWYHFAATRNGGTLRLFVNGVLDASSTLSNDITSTNALGIGDRPPSDPSGSYPFNGYIDDLRITNGVARYTANFTPPTAAFENK